MCRYPVKPRTTDIGNDSQLRPAADRRIRSTPSIVARQTTNGRTRAVAAGGPRLQAPLADHMAAIPFQQHLQRVLTAG